MAKLIYSAIASVDGYVADRDGGFGWAEPDEEVHAFVNDLERPIGTYLYGRRMYEVMAAWQTMDLSDEPPHMRDYAEIWRGADKVVYSTTLRAFDTPKTRLERTFDVDAVRAMRNDAASDLLISGPTLAAHAFRAGLIQECHVFLAPVTVGGGVAAFPVDVGVGLRLDDVRPVGGMVYLRYLVDT